MNINIHELLQKTLKIILRIFVGFLFLLVFIILMLRLPFVQKFITGKALEYYSERVDTPASIGGIYLDFPMYLSIHDMYFEDQAGDTLLYTDRIRVKTDFLALFGKKLRLNEVNIRGLKGNVHNSAENAVFNYQYIVDAFVQGDGSTASSVPSNADTASSAPFVFEIGEVDINNSRAEYHDYYHGIITDANIGRLIAEAETFDLDSPLINVSYLSLQDTKSRVEIRKGYPYPPDTVSERRPFHIGGEYAEILNTTLDLFVESAGLRLHTDVGQLNVEVDTLDINRQIYLAKDITLSESSVELDFIADNDSPIPDNPDSAFNSSDNSGDGEPFSLIAGTKRVDFHKNSFRMTDHNASPSEGFDPARLDLQEVGFSGNDLRMEDLFMSGELKGMYVRTAGGPSLIDGGFQFRYGPDQAYIRNLNLETEKSRIALDAEVQYADTTALMALADEVRITSASTDIKLELGDLYYFVPALQSALNEPPSTELEVSGQSSGAIGDLELKNWRVTLSGSALRIPSAHIQGLKNPLSARFTIPDLQVNANEEFIRRLAGDSLAAAYRLPKTLSMNSSFNGSLDDFDLSSRVSTPVGGIEAWVDYTMPEDSIPVYSISLLTDSLDVGYILADTTMGKVVLQAKADGRGIDEEHLEAQVILDVPYVRYNSYAYRGLCGQGQLDGFTYSGTLVYHDENLQFEYEGLVSLPVSGGRQDFDLTVDLAKLNMLNFTRDQLAITASVKTRLTIPETGDPEGTVAISKAYLSKDQRLFNLDTLGIEAGQNDSLRYVKFDSRFLEMLWQTNFPIAETGNVIWNHLDHYFNADSTDVILKGDEYFEISVDVTDPVLLTEAILPDLNYIQMDPLKAKFDASTSTMDLELRVDSISYLSLAMDSLGFQIHSTRDKLRSDLKIKQLTQGPAMIHHTWLHTESDIGMLNMMLRFRDPDRMDKYRMGASLKRVGDILEFRADGDSLMLNYHDWKIPDNNLIQFAPSGVWFENFRMTWRDKMLGVESTLNAQSDTVTSILAQNIRLGELTRFNRDSTSIITGLLDGRIDLTAGEGLPGITADLNVTDLTVLGEAMGEFEVKSGISSGTVYEVGISLVGQENNLSISGDYDTSSADDINLVADIQPLSLKAMSVFVSNQLSEVHGKVLGRLNITGSISKPNIDGYLSFENAGFRVNYLQNKLSVNDQRLEVDHNTFRFNNFRITDEKDHHAIIDGRVSTRDFFKYDFNLNATTDNFTLVDSKKGDNELFYGLLRATSEVKISGNSYLPKVNLNLELSDDSYFTYVIPEATIQEQMQNDVVRFVDKDAPDGIFLMDVNQEARQNSDTLGADMRGIDLTASIKVSPENKLQIVIDPVTGDQLTVKGDAMLNLAIRPTGDINLTGRYQVNQGSYSMNFYGLVQREFNIREGSSIQWTGDPYSARMDVVAEYSSRASPPLPSFKSKLEFIVALYLKGQILEPEISFGLNIPENEPAPIEVQSWLAQLNQDEAELNKQVFGLLILNGFFDSGGTNSYDHLAQNTLRSSVSSLLSGELSKLTDQIEGVELSMAIDSYEDYNQEGQSIGRTQLELGLSKNFFDDRVIVKVAGNFDLEGSNSYRNNVSDFAGDIRIEYKLTEDGRFRLVGFRETNYDDLIQGEIIKTGGGFIYVKNYNAFRELFKKDESRSNE